MERELRRVAGDVRQPAHGRVALPVFPTLASVRNFTPFVVRRRVCRPGGASIRCRRDSGACASKPHRRAARKPPRHHPRRGRAAAGRPVSGRCRHGICRPHGLPSGHLPRRPLREDRGRLPRHRANCFVLRKNRRRAPLRDRTRPAGSPRWHVGCHSPGSGAGGVPPGRMAETGHRAKWTRGPAGGRSRQEAGRRPPPGRPGGGGDGGRKLPPADRARHSPALPPGARRGQSSALHPADRRSLVPGSGWARERKDGGDGQGRGPDGPRCPEVVRCASGDSEQRTWLAPSRRCAARWAPTP